MKQAERREASAKIITKIWETIKQKNEQHASEKERKKIEERDQRLKAIQEEFPVKLIYRITDYPFIDNSIIMDTSGNRIYRIRAKMLGHRRQIEIYDKDNKKVAIAEEKKPYFDFFDCPRMPEYRTNIKGVQGEAYDDKSGVTLNPYGWSTSKIEKGFKFAVKNKQSELIAVSEERVNAEGDHILFFKEDMVTLHVLLMMLIANAINFSPRFYNYYERIINKPHDG